MGDRSIGAQRLVLRLRLANGPRVATPATLEPPPAPAIPPLPPPPPPRVRERPLVAERAPAPPPPPPEVADRPAAAALLDALRALPPLPACTLEPLAEVRADVTRYRLDSAAGLVGEVLVEPSANDDWQASFDAATDPYFGELYEVIADLGDAAAWAPLSHTLRIRVGDRRITVDIEVPFGTDPRPEQLEVAVAAAREALRAL